MSSLSHRAAEVACDAIQDKILPSGSLTRRPSDPDLISPPPIESAMVLLVVMEYGDRIETIGLHGKAPDDGVMYTTKFQDGEAIVTFRLELPKGDPTWPTT